MCSISAAIAGVVGLAGGAAGLWGLQRIRKSQQAQSAPQSQSGGSTYVGTAIRQTKPWESESGNQATGSPAPASGLPSSSSTSSVVKAGSASAKRYRSKMTIPKMPSVSGGMTSLPTIGGLNKTKPVNY